MEGSNLSTVFQRTDLGDPFLLTLVAMGEAQGNLSQAFQQAGLRYHQEADRTIRILTTLMEPLMILIVGGLVGGIVISMLLPIFQINFAVG
jgi:type II secretory pathway component PulF